MGRGGGARGGGGDVCMPPATGKVLPALCFRAMKPWFIFRIRALDGRLNPYTTTTRPQFLLEVAYKQRGGYIFRRVRGEELVWDAE